jgi:peptide/nickel transport system substrate-binding protein
MPQAALLCALVAAAGVLLLALVPRAGGARARVAAEGGTLREAVAGPAVRVNPLDGRATPAERDLAVLMFAGLTRPGPDGAPLPALAESWEVEADARVFTFRLRRGLTWHDGHPLTAEDVLFTVGAIAALGERADPRLADVWTGAAVSRLGDLAVRVELPEPFAPLPAYASFGLLPAHRLAAGGPLTGDEEFFRAPVGAGPFRLVSLTAEGATLRRFAGYALGPPWLEAVELRFVASAAEVERSLAAGTVDAAAGGARADAGTADATGGLVAHVAARSAYAMVLLNHGVAPFGDARVRRALSLAVDRDALAARAGGVAADTPFAPGWWAWDGRAPPAADAAAARRLLEEAGWSRGGDGVARREGRELAFTLLVAAEGGRETLARALAEAWGALGVRVTVAPVAAAALLRDFLAPRAYQAALVPWDPGMDPDPFSAWHASLRGHGEGNLGDTADPELDRLAEAARAARTVDERRALYARFSARFRETAPGIVLFAEGLEYRTRSPLAGLDVRALAEPSARFAGVYRWYARTRPA